MNKKSWLIILVVFLVALGIYIYNQDNIILNSPGDYLTGCKDHCMNLLFSDIPGFSYFDCLDQCKWCNDYAQNSTWEPFFFSEECDWSGNSFEFRCYAEENSMCFRSACEGVCKKEPGVIFAFKCCCDGNCSSGPATVTK